MADTPGSANSDDPVVEKLLIGGLIAAVLGGIGMLATDSPIADALLGIGILALFLGAFINSVTDAQEKFRKQSAQRIAQEQANQEHAKAQHAKRAQEARAARAAAARTKLVTVASVTKKIGESAGGWTALVAPGTSHETSLDILLPLCVQDSHLVRDRFLALARAKVPSDARIIGLDISNDRSLELLASTRFLAKYRYRIFTDRGVAVAERGERIWAPAGVAQASVDVKDDTGRVTVDVLVATESIAWQEIHVGEDVLYGSINTPGPLQQAAMAAALGAAFSANGKRGAAPRNRPAAAPSSGPARTARARIGMARPEPHLIRTDRDAELVAARWMQHWGYADAVCTPVGADEGVDVASAAAVGQVKFEAKPVGRPVIQNIYGVAQQQSKEAFVFSSAGYTQAAHTWADKVGVALFQYDLQGEPSAFNAVAHERLKRQ